jgi:hypothetical protein
MPGEAHDRIATTEVVLPISQHEIYIYAPPSTGGSAAGAGFGLIGALVGAAIDASVDANRTKEAEAAAKPLRDALVDYNFDQTLKDDVSASLASLGWMKVDSVRVAKELTTANLDGSISGSKDSGVLIAIADYRIDYDGSALTISLTARYYPNSDALRALHKSGSARHPSDDDNALFKDNLIYSVRLAQATPDRNQNIAVWSANGGAVTRAQINQGLAKLAWMLGTDLVRTNTDAPSSAPFVKVNGVDAQLVANDSDGQVYRFKHGALQYIPARLAGAN